MSSFVSTLSTLSLKQGNWEEVDLSEHLGGQIELVCQPEHWVRKLRRGLPFCAARCQVLFIPFTFASVSTVDNEEKFDFSGLRLDWFRLQVRFLFCSGPYP